MVGVEGTDVDEQLDFLRSCFSDPVRDYLNAHDIDAHARGEYGDAGYGVVEAEVLYAFVATQQPRRVIQIGAGYSSAVMLAAAKQSEYSLGLTCVEPYPSAYLRSADKDGVASLIEQPAQKVPFEKLADLEAGDLLFIDSTHTVKAGSEVNYLIQEVLPRLAKGVWVHFHDIYFPYDYHRSLMREVFFPLESTLLHAFLIDNHRYTIRASMSMLHYARPQAVQALIPRYQPQHNDHGLPAPGPEGERGGRFPSSIYLQLVG